MKTKTIGIIILCIVMLSGCTGSVYLNESTEKPAIQIKGNTFDITVDECIEILNEDIKKKILI